MKKTIIIFWAFYFLGSCNHHHQVDQKAVNKIDTVDTILEKSMTRTFNNIDITTISGISALGDKEFMARLEKLKIAYIEEDNRHSLDTINSIACISDGYVSTDISVTCVAIFELKPIDFILYITTKTDNCLYKALLNGFNAELVVYEGEEREVEIKMCKQKIINLLKTSSLTKEQKYQIEKLAADIDPSVFD